jgi:hypothetical protein
VGNHPDRPVMCLLLGSTYWQVGRVFPILSSARWAMHDLRVAARFVLPTTSSVLVNPQHLVPVRRGGGNAAGGRGAITFSDRYMGSSLNR